jgi:hypothetical protein
MLSQAEITLARSAPGRCRPSRAAVERVVIGVVVSA